MNPALRRAVLCHQRNGKLNVVCIHGYIPPYSSRIMQGSDLATEFIHICLTGHGSPKKKRPFAAHVRDADRHICASAIVFKLCRELSCIRASNPCLWRDGG